VIDLPRTDAVNRVIDRLTPEMMRCWPVSLADELGRLLARCLVRDEEEALEAEEEAALAEERERHRDVARRHALAQRIEQEPPPSTPGGIEWRHALSQRTRNALRYAGIEYVWQLASFVEGGGTREKPGLLRMKNCGRKTHNECAAMLAGLGFTWGMADDPDVVALREGR
jgi:DNA-directed RNA polymerase alpha subunit